MNRKRCLGPKSIRFADVQASPPPLNRNSCQGRPENRKNLNYPQSGDETVGNNETSQPSPKQEGLKNFPNNSHDSHTVTIWVVDVTV